MSERQLNMHTWVKPSGIFFDDKPEVLQLPLTMPVSPKSFLQEGFLSAETLDRHYYSPYVE